MNKGTRIRELFGGLQASLSALRLTCLVAVEDVGSSKAEDRVPPSNKPGFSFAVTRLGGGTYFEIRADSVDKEEFLSYGVCFFIYK